MSVEIHVAADGRDTHSGTRKRPFATLARARDALRALPAEERAGSTVWIGGGDYPLTDPVRAAAALSTEAGDPYVWPGGVGKGRSVVAFAAICAHRMTHPSRDVSFINYRHGKARFFDSGDRTRERSGVIFCCSEKSVYDPADGARVLGGPAKQPLATILLQAEPGTGALYALGTIGGEMYDAYFEKFAFRLALEHRTSDIQRRVGATSEVMDIEAYSRTVMRC